MIKLDGETHLAQKEYDKVRDDCMRSAGFKTLRFWNHQVFEERDKVLQEIYTNLI